MAVKKITNSTMVECKNGVHGPLIYISSRTAGYMIEWEEFGEVQEIEYGELVAMRGSQPRFFRDNWILIEDADVLKALGVARITAMHSRQKTLMMCSAGMLQRSAAMWRK